MFFRDDLAYYASAQVEALRQLVQQIPDAVELQVGRYIWKGYPSHMARQTKQPDTKDARYVEVEKTGFKHLIIACSTLLM